MPDLPPFVWAIVALSAMVVLSTFLYRMRKKHPYLPPEEEGAASRPTEADRVKIELDRRQREQREYEQKVKKEFEADVLAGKVLPDGRLKCLASPSCPEEAVHRLPLIQRDTSLMDFIRRGFGAPERYRMVEERGPGFLQLAWTALSSAWSEPQKRQLRRPASCDMHHHVALQICQAKLAADEREEQDRRKSREVGLATFEGRGMLLEVQRLVAAADAEAVAEPDKKPRRSRRPPKDAKDKDLRDLLKNGSGMSNGNGSSKGAYS